MKLKTIFVSLAAALSLNAFSQGAWNPKPTFAGGPRSSCIGFGVGQGAYVGLGVDSNSFRRTMYVFNIATDSWVQAQSMGGATGQGLGRNVAVCFVISTKAYVGTGQGSNPFFDDLWEYDSGSDTWSQKANFPAGGRRSAVAFAANSKGYVCTGQDVNFALRNDLWEYNPASNTWLQKANFPGTARRLAVAFVINNRAYVGSGDDGAFKGDFFEYDPAANFWTPKATFPGTARYGATAFAIGTKGYFGLGYDNTLANRKDFWQYDQPSNTWTQINNFGGTPRSNAVGFSVGSKAYVACGFDGNVTLDEFWEFDPSYTGIEEKDGRSQLSIYPNPMKDFATVELGDELQQDDLRLLLIDAGGRIVREEKQIRGQRFQLERGDLRAGIYFYVLAAGEQELDAGKLIVQ